MDTTKFTQLVQSLKGLKKSRLPVPVIAVSVAAILFAAAVMAIVLMTGRQEHVATTIAATPAPKVTSGSKHATTSTPIPTFSSANGPVFTFHGLKLQLPSAPKYYPWKKLPGSSADRTEISSCPGSGCVSVVFYNYALTPKQFVAENHDCTVRIPGADVAVGGQTAHFYKSSGCLGGDFIERAYLLRTMIITVTRPTIGATSTGSWLGAIGAIDGTGPHQPSVVFRNS